jgi:hypothetical protein
MTVVVGMLAVTAAAGTAAAGTAAAGTRASALGRVGPGGGAAAPLTAGEARALARHVTDPVIVVFKNQVTAAPDTAAREATRAEAIAGVQRDVLAELAETGAERVHSYQLLDALSATVSAGEARRLAANPAVAEVVADEDIPLANGATAATAAAASIGKPVAPAPFACAAPGHVQLDPQALKEIDARSQTKGAGTAASLGYTGAGVKVAFLADGLDIDNPEFIRADGQHVFVDYRDFSGSGTASPTGGGEAFLDAGSIAAQGRKVYNVSHYSDLPLSRPCDIRIEGVAPGASLVGLDVFGSDEVSVGSAVFLQAVDWAVTHDHVNVLNESFGANHFPDIATLDLVDRADDAAVAAGVTVTVSSGDSGITDTIASPASDPEVISAGATTTYRIDAQDGYGGARLPGVKGWLDNNISSFSSAGETESGRTVDVVAPGELNWLPCSTDVEIYSDCVSYTGSPSAVEATGGTSESAPVTAGVAALVIQAYREGHRGRTPTPAVVKQIVTSTARPIDAPADQEGAGIVDAYQAVLAARSFGATAAASRGETLLSSPSQLDVSAAPRTAESLAETVTNNGAATQTVTPTLRTLGPYSTVATARVTLADNLGIHPLDWEGVRDNVARERFTVPPGKDRLNASIAFQNVSATDPDARVRLTLVDPNGRLAAYSVPQGDGNYGDAQVAAPAAGVWTAYIYSRDSLDGGTTGKVVFGAGVADWTAFGKVTPLTLTLAPHQSGAFTVAASTLATPGDQAASLVLRSTTGHRDNGTTSVPIVLRSLIPIGPTQFTGTLTGGNGRAAGSGQTAYYQMRIPAGTPALNASITLVGSPLNPYSAALISPGGQAVALGSNETIASSAEGPTGVPSLGAELHVLAPAAGTWDLVIDFLGQVSGTVLSEPYTVAVDETPVTASSTGLPDSTSTVLPAGQPSEATVTVRNEGTAPQAYFVDARLHTTSTVALAAISGPATTFLPNSTGVVYVVPTETTGLAWSAGSTVRAQAELEYAFGDPDLIGGVSGKTASGSFPAVPGTTSPVVQGPWVLTPQEIGPDGASGATGAASTTALRATTATFDPTVTSSTGDLWKTSIDPTTTLQLIVVGAGQSAQIPVTITPKGAPGATVTGTLYVDDANLIAFGVAYSPDADQVAALPYSYTIGS